MSSKMHLAGSIYVTIFYILSAFSRATLGMISAGGITQATSWKWTMTGYGVAMLSLACILLLLKLYQCMYRAPGVDNECESIKPLLTNMEDTTPYSTTDEWLADDSDQDFMQV